MYLNGIFTEEKEIVVGGRGQAVEGMTYGGDRLGRGQAEFTILT